MEFHRPAGPWVADAGPVRGIWMQSLAEDPATGAGTVLVRDDPGVDTGLVRYEPGVDTSPLGTRVDDYREEVYLLEGDLTDLRLGETFDAGMYACRPPDMPHGPWRTERGVLMLEVRYP